MSWTGKPCLFTIQNLIKRWHFTVLWSVTLKIGALTKLGLFFLVVCFIHVFDQIVAEQLYRDKGLPPVVYTGIWYRRKISLEITAEIAEKIASLRTHFIWIRHRQTGLACLVFWNTSVEKRKKKLRKIQCFLFTPKDRFPPNRPHCLKPKSEKLHSYITKFEIVRLLAF